MTILNTFDPKKTANYIVRIEKLTPETQPSWGKMNVAQMLAHVNVTYDMAYGKIVPNNNKVTKFILKTFVKGTVVGPKPYKKSSKTAPVFIISDIRDFEKEKQILVDYIKLTEEKGTAYFEGLENVSFGKLSSNEWSIMFSKHLAHHLEQFGV